MKRQSNCWESRLHTAEWLTAAEWASAPRSPASQTTNRKEAQGQRSQWQDKRWCEHPWEPGRREVLVKQTQKQFSSDHVFIFSESCPTCGLYIFPLWSHALIPALNWLFQLISHVLIRAKTLQEMRLFRTENRSSVQTSSWPAAISTPSFAFLTFHNYMPNYPLLGGLVCMTASKLRRSKQAEAPLKKRQSACLLPLAEKTSEMQNVDKEKYWAKVLSYFPPLVRAQSCRVLDFLN